MRILILGTGSMANRHAENFAAIPGVSVVAGVDVVPDQLKAFCEKHKIGKSFATLDEALAWGEFDAVANVTPDAVHYSTTMKAIAAKKHVFGEKPLATDAVKAMEMTEAIEKAGLVGMVNLTYRNSPALQQGRKMVLNGDIGAVRHVEAQHLQSWLVGKGWGDWKSESRWLWRLSKKHGSNGALGDIGIHIVDFASYGSGLDIDHVFGRLKTFHKAPGDKIGEYDLDVNDCFVMSVDFTSGAIGTIQASRTAAGQFDQLRLRVYGEKGAIEMIYDTGRSYLRACVGERDLDTAVWRDLPYDPVETNYQRFAAAVKAGKTQEPSFRRAATIQKVLDQAQVSDREKRDEKVK